MLTCENLKFRHNCSVTAVCSVCYIHSGINDKLLLKKLEWKYLKYLQSYN